MRRKREGLKTAYHPRAMLEKEELRKRFNERRKRLWRKRKGQIDIVFGVRCFICNSPKYPRLHRKDGKNHPTTLGWLRKALEKPEEWVRLCNRCHNGVHFCMEVFGWDWDTILNHIK